MMFFRSGFLFSIFLLSFLSFSAYANAATVPNPPTGLTARNTGLQVTLSWTPGSDGGSAITNYKIYRNTSSPATTLLATIGNLAGYNDQTILANTTYYYRVTATNSVGEGTYSNEVNTMPQRAAIN
jgi:fibronectin type 3 domain-containing protein